MAADYVLSHQPAKGYHWNLVDRSITADILIDEPTASQRIVATRPCCAATTVPSSPATRWPTGPADASAWRSSRRAQRLHRVHQQPDLRLDINSFWSLPEGPRGDHRLEG